MSTSAPTTSVEQYEYEKLLATEKRLRDEFIAVRDSGEASQRAIDVRYVAFNNAILQRSEYKKRFPFVKEAL